MNPLKHSFDLKLQLWWAHQDGFTYTAYTSMLHTTGIQMYTVHSKLLFSSDLHQACTHSSAGCPLGEYGRSTLACLRLSAYIYLPISTITYLYLPIPTYLPIYLCISMYLSIYLESRGTEGLKLETTIYPSHMCSRECCFGRRGNRSRDSSSAHPAKPWYV